ncbi:hypothetical protein KIH39_23330 [Telmatocola sphagniphila]|uniref:Uncharacterized protein n=1 Tax=Telmatocola sphagniphila TaxID=1123043 RepID=A0A8E6B3Y5_9BACT|nr:hypothetical protein [Telmatocola sphagniphila]QVL31740.1 hypothetical protein KIH39_23330 [Telmatocola sphagniphila]
MPWTRCLEEFREVWLPNVTISGLDRVSELLEQASPLLIHGMFTHAMPRGCLATHIAWHHPKTTHITLDAGITWLTKIARLNPATSETIKAWDSVGLSNWELRQELLTACRNELARREKLPVNRIKTHLEALA